MLKKLLANVLICGSIMLSTPSFAADLSNPYTVIEQPANHLFPHLKEKQSEIKANPDKVKDLIKQDLMPFVDIKYAAFKVLGSSISETNETQRSRFVKAFETYIIDTYASAVAKYNDQTIEIDKKVQQDEKNAIVNVTVNTADKQKYNVLFKLRKNNKTSEWKVYDMVAEGISLLSSKQAEFSSLITKHGIDEVCRKLENHELKVENQEK
jgi:phospholipid transport system substrate-binding protein